MINDNITYHITDKLLGKGGFGSIYLCYDQNNKKYAIKCCDVNPEIGIKHLLEPIIMSTILHPYLNHCEKIYVSEKKLYMIQECAKSDLAQYTRRNKENYRPSTPELKSWCYCLLKALSVLHSNNIIHADIKANNILLFHDNTIKLSDFNLSVLKSNKETMYNHKVGTMTHRPLEVLTKQNWNELIDVWSLGCTFYEIAYGILLFPCQQEKNKTKCYINSILEWDKFTSKNFNISYQSLNSDDDQILKLIKEPNMYETEYNSPSLCNESKDLSKIVFNDLLYQMLIVDQHKRFTVKNLLDHSFITNLPIKYQLIKCNNSKIIDYDKNIIKNYINNLTEDEDIINLSYKIYECAYFITDYTQELKAIACTLIASKLLHKRIQTIEINILNTIISIESDICNNLKFHFNL